MQRFHHQSRKLSGSMWHIIKHSHQLFPQVNARFSSMLRSSIDDALSRGDGDFCGVDIGRVFVDGLFMLRAYESYCTRQVRMSSVATFLIRKWIDYNSTFFFQLLELGLI